jgi:7-cyano-7-deazaguanine synthase in queuosine biosynthesis
LLSAVNSFKIMTSIIIIKNFKMNVGANKIAVLQQIFGWISSHLVRKNIDVNEHERLSNITIRYKLKKRNTVFIVVLHSSAYFMYNSYLVKFVIFLIKPICRGFVSFYHKTFIKNDKMCIDHINLSVAIIVKYYLQNQYHMILSSNLLWCFNRQQLVRDTVNHDRQQ